MRKKWERERERQRELCVVKNKQDVRKRKTFEHNSRVDGENEWVGWKCTTIFFIENKNTLAQIYSTKENTFSECEREPEW